MVIQTGPPIETRGSHLGTQASQRSVAIVTSIHLDFDARIWKHARSLAKAGILVHLVCPWKVNSAPAELGITFHAFRRVERRSLRMLLVPWRVLRALRRCLRGVDIVHFHDIDLLPWMAALSLFKPVVYDIHENYPEEMMVREWVPKWARWLMFHAVRSVQWLGSLQVRNLVLVARSQEADLPRLWVRKLYLRNYASLELVTGVVDNYSTRPDAVVFTGAHHISNGSLLLLEIASRCAERFPDLQFLVTSRFASEAFREQFQLELRLRRLEGRIQVLPYVRPDQIMSVLNRATIAISPNLRVAQQINGVHTKLFEYMAAGLPIVASDLPHQVHVIGRAGAGLLARPEDPESFVARIGEIIGDRSRARTMGAHGQRAFRDYYSWESQVPALVRFYEEVLEH